nr:hypothetical protein [Tanacetum cinerariifolium]
NMDNENVPAPAPTRSNDQILPFNAWLSTFNNFRIPLLMRQRPEYTIFSWMKTGDEIMDFVNALSYPEEIHFLSRMAVNNLYQPWRAILSMISQCLTGKTSRFDRPIYPVLYMLWGIVTRTNVDYVELMWAEFVQAIQTFFADKANMGIAKKDKKIKPHVIPYCRFTKLIICNLGRKHNINQRNASYYNAYLEMVAKHDHKIAAEEGEKKKSAAKANQSKKPATAKQPKPMSFKQSKPAPAKQPKPVKEKSIKPSLVKKATEEEKTAEIDEGQARSDPVKHLSLDHHRSMFSWKKTRLD